MKRASRAKLRTAGNQWDAPNDILSCRTFEKALEAATAGNHAAAIVLYRQTLAQQPNHFGAHNFLGCSLREHGDLVGAIACYNRALELQPRSLEVRVHLAEAQRRLGQPQQAVTTCTEVLDRQRHNAEALLVRGMARRELGEMSGAIDDMQRAAKLKSEPPTLKMLARVLIEAGRKADAIIPLRAALNLDPKDFETQRLAGDCLSSVGEIKEAFKAYQISIDLNPKDPFAYANLSGMLCFTGQVDLAIAAGKIAIRLAPDMYGAHFNLAMAYETKQEPREALAAYAQALRCKPDLGVALLSMCRLLRHECEWDGIESSEGLAQTLTYKRGHAASPFAILPMATSPRNLLECNSVWADAMAESRSAPLAHYEPRPIERQHARIRIGYLSADFHQHATAALISEIFELHDKTKFETFGYSIGNADDTIMRHRIVAALDHFIDLNRLSHAEAAARIREDEIDILIDLKGYTSQARPQIMAHRAAPIQVNYLGYPSTMGATFIDYIIADAIVAPTEHSAFFKEKIVHLPNSYQPNDRKRRVADHVPTRIECGLPQDGFVFCCFNANYKLNAQIFEIWMRLLEATPGSVLWLLESNSRAPENLRREASTRGIDPARLVFAPKLHVDDHLARMHLGDLFLDTLPIGAHTTASEALWTGLPVLTCLGDAFPGRVGASLLHAMGMPELITSNLADYEATALRLAHDAAAMKALRTKLRDSRMTAPLFDSARYTRHYEAALTGMMERRDGARPPEAFTIEDA